MTTHVRWGLLGTARINRRLIPAMRAARRSELVAVASRHAARASAFARDWNIGVVHDSYEALLRDRTVDAVYIPLPNALHVAWTLRALDAGKHVLCEKPLALDPDDVDRVAAVARARGLVAVEGFMFRHEPLMTRIIELLRGGAVGEIDTITAGFSFLLARDGDVRLDVSLGGGSLWDVGCYAVNISRVVAGAEPLSAIGGAVRGPTGIDVAFNGVLQFPNGAVASIHSSFRSPYRTWLDVSGRDGVLRVANPFKPDLHEVIEVRRGAEVERITVDGSPALFLREVEDFIAAVVDGKAPAVSLADSRGNAATLAALSASARTGAAVTV